jgi:NAD(P)-dependent dehydrogenase (short-subunit alcohol dehydrogenase family)
MLLTGTVALVTGASRGLGAAVAIALATHGAQVVLIARTQSGLEETDDAIRAAGGSATLLPMDLREGDQVDLIAPSLFQRFGRLDILVSNAGDIGTLTPTPHIDMKEWASVHALNVEAPLRLIRGCAPLLLAAPAGRAVFVTADAASAPHAYWGHYAASLAAARSLALTWAAETVQTRLRVNLFDPGPMATRLRRRAFPGEPADTHPAPASVAPRLVALCLPVD